MPSSKSTRSLLILSILIFLLCGATAQNVSTVSIPLGGNAFIVQGTENGARITNKGLTHWTNKNTITSVYYHSKNKGKIRLFLYMPQHEDAATISIEILGKKYSVHTKKALSDSIKVAEIEIPHPGYIRINIQGIKKSGNNFGQIQSLILKGEEALEGISYVKEKKDFHFGRRGPSVHWNFKIPDKLKNNVAYFYNEIYVPTGQDVVGSYFEANGFSCGYFGMQVNSATERRILFSVWSPYSTNHPGEIPADKRIQLIKKGEDVHAGKFGGEGSGGQSYLKFNWKSNTHYAFLLKAAPDSIRNTTTFTAYFKQADSKDWTLIASFERPHTYTSLKQLYSFLENFSPSMGNIQRRGYYTNQWVCDFNGQWLPITQAKFTTDATGNAGQRLDYYGGVDAKGFYLENCGFFDKNGRAITQKVFTSPSKAVLPKVDFSKLP